MFSFALSFVRCLHSRRVRGIGAAGKLRAEGSGIRAVSVSSLACSGLGVLSWVAAGLVSTNLAGAAEGAGVPGFQGGIRPLLQEYCFDCHGDGADKGQVRFDGFPSDEALRDDHELWWRVLKNVRSGLMPPARKKQPTAAQKEQLETWIRTVVFQADPANPDPGRVTVRRLNRVEYHNTIQDLLGVDFNTQAEFPADNTGHGFDNLGEVLTLSPMLLEKYLDAARVVVTKAVPMVSGVPAERVVAGRDFRGPTADASAGKTNRNAGSAAALTLSYYQATAVTNHVAVEHAGKYQLGMDLQTTERFVDNQFDYNKARLVFRVDGVEVWQKEFTREGNKPFPLEFSRDWAAGEHELVLEVQPLTPDVKQVRSLAFRLDAVTVRGPMDPARFVLPKNYRKFFPRDVPPDPAGRREYARELLSGFARQAYRRPVDTRTVDRLVALAERGYGAGDSTFEAAIAQSMVAVLASPRFLFREEGVIQDGATTGYPLVDEPALASRLSYFLWSTMPDAELMDCAERGVLRAELPTQLRRMLASPKAEALTKNFVGQWLQVRDIDGVPMDARAVLQREELPDPVLEEQRTRWRALRNQREEKLTTDEKAELAELGKKLFRNQKPPRAELTGDLRRSLRQETEKTFDYILREDRSLLELLDSDYTFLNERLAIHYGLTNLNVTGDELRRVVLPAGNPRGGVLTQGAFLAVSSNPTRTSPVKRGVFILDNILGTPAPPPPPDVPALEDAAKGVKERTLSLRETLAVHRENPKCASCHDRMDPLGLAFENFNAMGMWRDQERGGPIDVAGRLLSGESFANVSELKRILAREHRLDFYRTLTDKLLTYALGRGLEYSDVVTIDQIVDRLVASDGRPSALFRAVVESAPFQKTRRTAAAVPAPVRPAGARTEARLNP